MCPVCIATAALVAGKATSTAGLAALAVKKTWHRLPLVKHVAQLSGCGEEATVPRRNSTHASQNRSRQSLHEFPALNRSRQPADTNPNYQP